MDPIVLKQREFYKQHKTLDINFRINALKTLKKAILAYEDRINEAIKMDVGKSNFETYMCEVGLALSELTYMENTFVSSLKKGMYIHHCLNFCRVVLKSRVLMVWC